jgi:hypothetical protein
MPVANTLINWTKQNLDAYLAMAETMACEWNVKPGKNLSMLCCVAVWGVGWESCGL